MGKAIDTVYLIVITSFIEFMALSLIPFYCV